LAAFALSEIFSNCVRKSAPAIRSSFCHRRRTLRPIVLIVGTPGLAVNVPGNTICDQRLVPPNGG
jgi:hypothetical protein